MKVVGLVSSFREGPMLASAVRSLAMLDHTFVYEGPVEGNPAAGPESEVGLNVRQPITVVEGEWATDAAKRTAMVEAVQARFPGEEVWGVWLDGDEILLWGEYLSDWIWGQTQQAIYNDPDAPLAHCPLPLVELSGLTIMCLGKVIRVDLIERYLISSSYMEWKNGYRMTFGNVDHWNPVDGPLILMEDGRPHWRARPPLQGEPHLQHRPVLRSRLRTVERQGAAEARNFEGVQLGP